MTGRTLTVRLSADSVREAYTDRRRTHISLYVSAVRVPGIRDGGTRC
jgi:hypothetical protein